MKKAELNKLISDGMKLDDIIDNNCEDFTRLLTANRCWSL